MTRQHLADFISLQTLQNQLIINITIVRSASIMAAMEGGEEELDILQSQLESFEREFAGNQIRLSELRDNVSKSPVGC